jgi:putative glutamine amidotransferase
MATNQKLHPFFSIFVHSSSKPMKTPKNLLKLVFIFWLAFFTACTSPEPQQDKLLIAISKERSGENKYSEWLASQAIPFEYIELYSLSLDEALTALEKTDALLLTGGNDIYPAWYGKEYDTARCGVFDRWRDTLEILSLAKAVELGKPVLGICRGLQLINVQQGGTLYIDLPSDKGTGDIHRQAEEGWTEHLVWLKPDGLLGTLIGEQLVNVASNHHQGIELLAPGLKALAFSHDDDLIEAIGFDNGDKPFLLAVQWHPEWMDYEDELSAAIARLFLSQATEQRNKTAN